MVQTRVPEMRKKTKEMVAEKQKESVDSLSKSMKSIGKSTFSNQNRIRYLIQKSDFPISAINQNINFSSKINRKPLISL